MKTTPQNTQNETVTARHTPGPWKLDVNGTSHFIKGGGRLIAGCYDPKQSPLWSLDQTANARLIAAAPELLEALQSAMIHSNVSWRNPQALDYCLAVIAKATGR